MTRDDVVTLLKKQIKLAGSQNKWARKNGFSPPYVHDVVNGRRVPADAICDALGLTRTVTYTRKKHADARA